MTIESFLRLRRQALETVRKKDERKIKLLADLQAGGKLLKQVIG